MAAWRHPILVAWLTLASSAAVSQEQLVILTTFSSEPIAELMSEYKQQNPKVDIKLIHRRTQSAIQLLNKSYIQDVDVVLSSSPFLMEELYKRKQLAKVAYGNEMPQWLVPFVLPKRNKVVSVGYSGAGLVWNKDYLIANNLKAPLQFQDLARFDYFGHITMSTPSRSGTTQMMIESILAKHGWDQGWAIIFNVGANLGTISSRSFGVADYVAKGQFGIGPTIDSYALVLPKQFQYVEFAYDSDFTLMPTYIGVLKKSADSGATDRFIRLLLSEGVQQSMIDTNFAKHSINDDSLFSDKNPALDLAKLMQREKLVNIIFDEAITKRLPELQDIWHSLAQLEQSYRSDVTKRKQLMELKHQLFSIPVSEQEIEQLGDSIASRVDFDSQSNGLEQAILAEFSYRFGLKFEANLDQVASELSTIQAESSL
ncbi:ABC transporter substrate-binding protein [Vibrio tubiashii]|nr:ABC transporter substrate-binding protein [Vibrio tubiashii]